jgi:protein TonB
MAMPLIVEIMAPEVRPLPPEPPKPPEPEPEPAPKAPPKYIKVAEKLPKPPELEPPPPPPAAAQAGKTLTIDDKDAPPDADAMVQGLGDQYVGGVTTTDGSSKRAVTDGRARGAGPPPAPPRPPEVDRSAKASLFLTAWNCDHLFPRAAANAGVRHASVHLIVRVGSHGEALGVRNLDDPGHGFGEAARKCAFQQQYRSARNRIGQPIQGETPMFAVGFHS